MRIVIVGGGKIGFALAQALSDEGHDIVVVDNDRENVSLISDSLDVIAVYGNGAALSVQRVADVDESDLLIAVTDSDEKNVFACLTAKKLGCPRTVARVRSAEYAEQLDMLSVLGISAVIRPELSAAEEIYGMLRAPAFLRRTDFLGGQLALVELTAQEGFALPEKLREKARLCLVVRGGAAIRPENAAIKAGDKLYIAAKTEALGELARALGLKNKPAKNIMVIGGGKIAEALVPMLLNDGANVKLFELDRGRCEYLEEHMHKAAIINSDGSKRAVLKMHNFEQMDAILPLTNIDEENIIISMLARRAGLEKVLTKINRAEYFELLGERETDSLISAKGLAADTLAAFTRADELIKLRTLPDCGAKALEFEAAARASGAFDANFVPVCAVSDGRLKFIGESAQLSEGDKLLCISLDGTGEILSDIFAEV